MKLFKRVAAAAAAGSLVLGLMAQPAFAQVSVKDAGGTTVPVAAVTDGSGNKVPTHTSADASGNVITPAKTGDVTETHAAAGSDASKAISVQGVTGGKAVKVDGSAVTQPVSAASLPLPTGAAQDSTVANTQANAGSDATKANAVQGITGGKPVGISTTNINAQVTPGGLSTSARSTGTLIGGIQQFTGLASTVDIQSLTVLLKSGTFQNGYIDVYLFNANPGTGTYTDGGSFTLNTTDALLMIPGGPIHLTDLTAASGAISTLSWGGSIPATLSGTTLYAVFVLRGSLTLAAATDFAATVGVKK